MANESKDERREDEILDHQVDDAPPSLVSSEDGSEQSEEGDTEENGNIVDHEQEQTKGKCVISGRSPPPVEAIEKNDPVKTVGDDLIRSQLASNQKWVLKSHPDLKFDKGDMALIDDVIELENLQEDEVVVRVNYLAIDPFIRTMIDSGDTGTIKINEPIKAMGVGTIITKYKKERNKNDDSYGHNDTFEEGSIVVGLMSASRFAVVKSNILQEKVAFAKPCAALGILGSSGETAFIGTFVAPSKSPQKGETVVVSAAADSTGCLVSQMAKFIGSRVVGIAFGEEQEKFLLEHLQLDAVIDYMDTSRNLHDKLEAACPSGVDFFFDSTGGDILDEVINHINTKARVVICGATSQYDAGPSKGIEIRGPNNYLKLAEKSASLHGFNTMDFPEHSFNATTYLGWNYMRGNFLFPQHIEIGIDNFASSIEKLFLNHYCGRLLVQVSDNFDIQDPDAERQEADNIRITKKQETKDIIESNNVSTNRGHNSKCGTGDTISVIHGDDTLIAHPEDSNSSRDNNER